MTLMNGTANAFRSLFPSPRYAIEGREGSGLHPDSLTHFDNLNINDGIIAKPTEQPSARKSLSLSQRFLRPFSIKADTSVSATTAGAAPASDALEDRQFAARFAHFLSLFVCVSN